MGWYHLVSSGLAGGMWPSPIDSALNTFFLGTGTLPRFEGVVFPPAQRSAGLFAPNPTASSIQRSSSPSFGTTTSPQRESPESYITLAEAIFNRHELLDGRLSGDDFVNFTARWSLPVNVLAEIWQVAGAGRVDASGTKKRF